MLDALFVGVVLALVVAIGVTYAVLDADPPVGGATVEEKVMKESRKKEAQEAIDKARSWIGNADDAVRALECLVDDFEDDGLIAFREAVDRLNEESHADIARGLEYAFDKLPRELVLEAAERLRDAEEEEE